MNFETNTSMTLSPFFHHLRTAYQAELDDLSFDTDGNLVLRQKIKERRQELNFLISMIELSPEMVAVVFHEAFTFHQPEIIAKLLVCDSGDLPSWDSLEDVIGVAPWGQSMVAQILGQPRGGWFLTVAVALEFMYGRAMCVEAPQDIDEDEGISSNLLEDSRFDEAEERQARADEEAGADWMVAQGFDRKE